MREIRLYGSEGGGAETNRLSLPLSSWTLPRPYSAEGRRRGASKSAFPRRTTCHTREFAIMDGRD